MYSTLYLKLFISVQIAKPLNIVSWSTEDLSSRNARTILNIVKSGSFRGPSGYGSAWKTYPGGEKIVSFYHEEY